MGDEIIEVTGKDALSLLFEYWPLDQNLTIRLKHRTGITTYRLPAVVTRDGYLIRSGNCPKNKDPRIWHAARRLRLAKQIRRMAKQIFE